jgi:hypothetical protein
LINSYQFIDYKFTKTRLANLTEEYNCLQLSVSCSFFRFSSIKGIKFDENVMFGEDVKFANTKNYILFTCLLLNSNISTKDFYCFFKKEFSNIII